jgi:hypothetical protein
MTNLVVNLPFFHGFYESALSQIMDNAVEYEVYNLVEKEESQEYYPESYWPEALRLDHSDLWESVSYDTAYRAIAKDWASGFDDWMNDNLGTPVNSFTFESMTSPRFYNFETDRLFVTVPVSVMESLYQGIQADKLKEIIDSRHSSRSGFISFYSADWDDWQNKLSDGLAGLDHNELATLLCAAIAPHIDERDDWLWSIDESVAPNGGQYLDSHCDWEGYETKCKQWRADKLARIIGENPDNAARLIAGCERIAALESLALESDEMDSEALQVWQGKQEVRAYRCTETRDMFADYGSAVFDCEGESMA